MKKQMVILASLILMLALFSAAFISSAQDTLAPEGTPQETYYAPFPLTITLDGDFDDWEGVPRVTIPRPIEGIEVAPDRPAVTFAVAADGEYLYFMGDIIDDIIVSGEHGTNYWDEDSVEFYVNGTGDLSLTQYVDGVAQITVPALNIGLPPEEVALGGVQGTTVDAQVVMVETETGYALEMAIPLENEVWNIEPEHARAIGFQVHLNGTSASSRDTKIIWSIFDTVDQSYTNPSVFGQLIFYEIGQTGRPDLLPTPTFVPSPTPIPIEADAVYRDPDAPIEERVEDLLSRMTLEEKIGQITLVENNSINDSDIIDMGIGALLSGGGGYPEPNTPQSWSEMVHQYQEYALQTRLGIPIIYSVDAVHGHNNMVGAVIFPHNIGLGAAGDTELMRRIGQVTARETAATGIFGNYGPAVSVPQDIRWGRTYEGYSENTELVSELAVAYLQGLQGDDLTAPTTIIGTAKHFIGDGGTAWGTSTNPGFDGVFQIDQGVTEVDEDTLRAVHLPPYIAAIENGARSIMISYSSWGGMRMHAQQYLITDVLKDELGFDGFVVSDWAAIDQINPNSYYDSVVTSTNAGIDMNMVPYNYQEFILALTQAVEAGDVSEDRINDAVRRILRVKFELGLFEHPFADESLLAEVGSAEHRAVAREAVSRSMVLLKNDNDALPISEDPALILVGGQGGNNIGIQLGGWSIEWQGDVGDITPGTTILEAIQNIVPEDTEIYYDRYGRFRGAPDDVQADIGIAVVGELPYAEGLGDSNDLTLSSADINLIEKMRERCDRLIVILISGRPMIITEQLDLADAFVAAWLPGTEGQGVADVLFGYQPFTGRLSFTWPRSMEQLPFDFDNLGEGEDGPLFPFGYGLETETTR